MQKWSKNGVEENFIKREKSTLLHNALLTSMFGEHSLLKPHLMNKF